MDTMGCFGRASTNKTCQFLTQNRWRQRFPFRIIRIFENRFTRSGAISILVEVLEFSKKVVFFDNHYYLLCGIT